MITAEPDDRKRLYQICTASRKTSQKSIRHSPLMTARIPNTHLIGVHCMTHKDLTKEKLSDAAKELWAAREKIRAVTGTLPEYVRPPYGNWNAKLEEAVDMIPVFWDVDSIDWRLKNTEKVTAKVVKDTEDGDIILMHDEFKTSVEAAFRIIDNLTAKGYTFVTVDELMVD